MSDEPDEEMIIGGRYRVVRELAAGGMGTVYEAENLRTRRRVAIKTIRPEVASRASVVHRFEVEAQAAGQLQHPNIVEVLDLGDDAEKQILFSVQEFLVGGDLGACLQVVGTLGPEAALATLLPILDGLAVAHRQGVVHRDIKPDNIFLHETPAGVVPKLIDFGVAKITSVENERRSANGSLVGSPLYMSPEQVRAEGDIDGRTDVWSMGVVFYEVLTGRTPFEAPNPYALLTQIALGQPLTLASLGPDLPADLVAAIQRAVTQDRDARWASVAEFADALRATEMWRNVDPREAVRLIPSAKGVTAQQVLASTKATLENPATTDPGHVIPSAVREASWADGASSVYTRSASRRGRTVWAVVASLCVALALGIAVTRAGGPSPDEPPPQVQRPRRAVARAPTEDPGVSPAAIDAGASAAGAVVTPDAGSAPVVAAPVVAAPPRRRQPARPAPVRRRAPEPATPAVTRGFNGAPIVD